MTARFQVAADLLTRWRAEILAGNPPVLYPVGVGDLARIEIGPTLVALMGGAPGAGKTAFTQQIVFDALRLTPSLRAIMCNVEMRPGALLDRQLARISGVDLSAIRYRKLDARHSARIDAALETLEPLAERMAFVSPPFNLENVAETADAFKADLILLDYIQRIPPPGEHGDRRGAIDKTMDYLRQFADADVAVVVVAAVARTKDRKGRSSYAGDGLNLASFRESSELEFGADNAFILVPDSKADDVVELRHLKARYSETKDILLRFERRIQRFTPFGCEAEQPNNNGLQSKLAALWKPGPATEDDIARDSK